MCNLSSLAERQEMKVEELLKPFPIKEFHPFPRAMLGPGAWELLGPEAKKLGFSRVLVMTSGLHGGENRRVAPLPRAGSGGLRQGRVQPQGLQRHGRRGALPGEPVRQLHLDR